MRVGHPARLSESVQRLSLDALLHTVDSAEIIMDVRQDIRKALVSQVTVCYMFAANEMIAV